MKKRIALLSAIILIQTVLIFIIFAFFKQGWHSDEVFNYAIANSYRSKELTHMNDGESLLHRWMDSDMFLEYISASEGHRFDYSVPLRNAANDLNPPFQYMILHTICSIFPQTFSWYYCFAINLIAFVVSQIYMYRLVKGMTGKEFAGFAAVILYGFGIGAMDLTLYIRIYALAVMFAIMLAFYSYQIYALRNEKKIPIRFYIGLFFSCFLGCLSLHLFLMVAFTLTLGYTLYFLFSKHIKVFLIHGFTCLGAALLSLAVVPKTFNHVGGFSEEHSFSSVSYPFLTDLRLYLYTITKDLFGIHVLSYDNVYLVSALVFLGAIIIFMIPIVFLVKKEKWFKSFLTKAKEKFEHIRGKRKNFCYPLIPLLLCIVVNLIVVVKWTSYYYMGEYSNRYVFSLYPLTIAFAVSLAYFAIQLLIEREKISAGILLGVCVILATWTHFTPQCWAYLFQHQEEGITFKTIGSDPNAREIIVFWDTETWILACFAPELYNTDAYYATDYSNYRTKEIFDDIDKNKHYYLIVDQHYILPEDKTYEDVENSMFYMGAGDLLYSEEDFLAFYDTVDCIDGVEYVGRDGEFGRKYKIYRVNFKE